MSDYDQFLKDAVADSEAEVLKWIDRTAAELRDTARRIEVAGQYLEGDAPNRASSVAREVGLQLRQPLGQNAQEFLLVAIANLSYWEGAKVGLEKS